MPAFAHGHQRDPDFHREAGVAEVREGEDTLPLRASRAAARPKDSRLAYLPPSTTPVHLARASGPSAATEALRFKLRVGSHQCAGVAGSVVVAVVQVGCVWVLVRFAVGARADGCARPHRRARAGDRGGRRRDGGRARGSGARARGDDRAFPSRGGTRPRAKNSAATPDQRPAVRSPSDQATAAPTNGAKAKIRARSGRADVALRVQVKSQAEAVPGRPAGQQAKQRQQLREGLPGDDGERDAETCAERAPSTSRPGSGSGPRAAERGCCRGPSPKVANSTATAPSPKPELPLP